MRASKAALEAAELLRKDRQQWFVVALHYAAMHLLMADLAGRDEISDEQRPPEQHNSRWDSGGGVRITWGVNDVVRVVYDPTVSQAYTSLFNASYAIRYKEPPRAFLTRIWSDWQCIAKRVNPQHLDEGP